MPSSAVVPQISVIVPVWNGAQEIGGLLDALENQTAPRDAFEVIVVDNGSTDCTQDVVRRYPDIRLTQETKPGSYAARNHGISLARAPFLLFTDADCLPRPDWIKAAIERASTCGENALIGGRIELFRMGTAGTYSSIYDEVTGFNQEWSLANGLCVTANWLVSRALMETVGGFDATLMSGGDSDCAKRIARYGSAFVYAPDMVVRHPTRARLRSLIRKKRRVVGGRWQLVKAEQSFVEFSRNIAIEFFGQARWLKNSDIPSSSKIGVLSVVFTLWLATQYELFRVAAGATPIRD